MDKKNYKYCPACDDWEPSAGEHCIKCVTYINKGCYDGVWNSYDGKSHQFFEMSTQHISNILYLWEISNADFLDVHNFREIIKARGEEQLPFKAHSPPEIEERIKNSFMSVHNYRRRIRND